MCGKPADSVKEELPAWFLEVAAKGTQESFKNLIIRKNIENNTMDEDAEVPLTAPLIKMISKRNWWQREQYLAPIHFEYHRRALPFYCLGS
jgi:hypothetical protein